jgi:hypothetical protein
MSFPELVYARTVLSSRYPRSKFAGCQQSEFASQNYVKACGQLKIARFVLSVVVVRGGDIIIIADIMVMLIILLLIVAMAAMATALLFPAVMGEQQLDSVGLRRAGKIGCVSYSARAT